MHKGIWVEHLALLLLHYSFLPFVVWLYLLHIEPSYIPFCVIACLPYPTIASELFWKYLEYPCSHQLEKQLQSENFWLSPNVSWYRFLCTGVVRSHAFCPHKAHMHMPGMQYVQYICIHTSEKIRHSTH